MSWDTKPHRIHQRSRLPVLLALLGVLVVAGPIACGKRGDPKPPEGVPVTHPRDYPTG